MKRIAIVALLAAGCLTEGRKASQESIRLLAARQMDAAARVVEISRAEPVSPAVADVVSDMFEDAQEITKWTALTISDFGRVSSDISLDGDTQASKRALYEREIALRQAASGAVKETLGITSDDGGALGIDPASALELLAGPIVGGIGAILWRRERKKKRAAEVETSATKDDLATSRQAVREAIQVIGQSKDTGIRKTAAQRANLLREFAKIKQEEYDERVDEIEHGGKLLQSTLSTEVMGPDSLSDIPARMGDRGPTT